MADPLDYPPFCDYRHADGTKPFADWVLIGESGDYYVCDWHFQARTEAGKVGWSRITP